MAKPLLFLLLVPARAPAQSAADAGQHCRLSPKMAIEPLSLAENRGANGTIDVASATCGPGMIIEPATSSTTRPTSFRQGAPMSGRRITGILTVGAGNHQSRVPAAV